MSINVRCPTPSAPGDFPAGTGNKRIGSFRWDMASGKVVWSDVFRQIIGLPADVPATYENWMAALHPADREAAECLLRQAWETRTGFEAEYRIVRRDGEVRWLVTQGDFVAGEDVQAQRLEGVVVDITALKRAERRNLHRSRVLEMLMSGVPTREILEGVVRFLEEDRPGYLGSILLLDGEKGCLLHGAGPSLPAEYNQAVHGLKIGPNVGCCGAAACLGRRVVAEDVATHPNWEPYRELTARVGLRSCWSEPVFSAAGKVLGTFAIYSRQPRLPQPEDLETIESEAGYVSLVIEHRRAEMALRESEERFRTTFENAAVGIAIVSPEGRWLRVNDRLCDIVRYSRDEMLAKTFGDITPPEDLALSWRQTRRVLAGELATYTIDKRYRRKDDVLVWISLTVSLVRRPDGEPDYFIAIVRDITAHKQAEAEILELNRHLERRVEERTAELQVLNRELEAFSYSVSHDLKAPLRTVNGFAKILVDDHGDQLDAEGRRLLEVVQQSAREMGELIDDLLAFSRMNRKDLTTSQIDMNALARQVWKVLEASRAGRQIDFRMSDLPPAMGDVVTVREVLLNLLDNAIKFTQHRETAIIRLTGVATESEVRYVVRDNGAGFDMARRNKLFGVFQRLHSREEFEGTGIGLALVQRIIQRHHGQVGAEGKIGEGASFWFTLPQPADLIALAEEKTVTAA